MRTILAPDRVFTALDDEARPSYVVVRDDCIEAVTETRPRFDNARFVALPGTTLVPGLIDAHTHLSILPSRGNQIAQLCLPADVQLGVARANVMSDLLAGVTTLRVMGQELDVDFTLADEIRTGATLGPDLVSAGVPLAKRGAHGYAITSVENEEQIQRLIERNIARGAGVVKIFVSGGVATAGVAHDECPFTDAEIRAAAAITHRHGMKLAAHAHGGEGAWRAIANGVDTIEHAALFDDTLVEALVANNLMAVATFSILEHPAGIECGDAGSPAVLRKVQEAKERVQLAWRAIIRAGARLTVGTDSMHGCLAYDIARLVDFGATPAQALRAATRGGAEACGLIDRGVLEPSRRADLVAVQGNPLEDIRAIGSPMFVMKAGKIVHCVSRPSAN
jgi:imidazolonepropionase-like amidohydrolase